LGVKRISIVRERPADKLFREADVRLCHDDYNEEMALARSSKQRRLLELFKRSLPNLAETADGLEQLLAKHVPLGVLTDIVAYTLDLGLARKEELLRETNVDRRVDMLCEYLAGLSTDQETVNFPPPFSEN
jgi:hypothetical protein